VSLFKPKYIATKICKDFCPEFFCSFLGLPGSFLGLSVGFLSNFITHQVPRKRQKASVKPQEATKKFRAEIPSNFCCYFGQNDDLTNSF
jgi:hypothetical protein